MPRGHGGSASDEIRAFVYGLVQGVGGVEYAPREIAKLVNDRFGFKISPKTVSNWKSNLPAEMQKYGITEKDIKEAVARGLLGDLRNSEEIREPDREDRQESLKGAGPRPEEEIILKPVEGNVAEMVALLEKQGFIVTTGLTEMKEILEAKGYQILDSSGGLFGIENIFIQPIELDIEVVGRSIIANPIIQFYYALARRKKEDLDITEWITACIVELYNNMEPPVRLMVAFG